MVQIVTSTLFDAGNLLAGRESGRWRKRLLDGSVYIAPGFRHFCVRGGVVIKRAELLACPWLQVLTKI